mgnify:FL=1
MREPLSAEQLEMLRIQFGTGTRLWSKMFSGLTALVYRQEGHDAVHALWREVLASHQDERYHEGLRKLGIDKDPPAVAAAKYHYYTNLIGGLTMHYAEESSKKVWIRYTAPSWTYDGVAMLAMPGDLRRTILGTWHPRNGEMMGCPRLGWVATKFIMEGDPYDEGYFMEYDHELSPEERYRIESVSKSPPHDPERAPTLDEQVWPEERLIRARRNFSSRYLRTTVEVLYKQFGETRAHEIISQTMRLLAIQYTHELSQTLKRNGNESQTVTGFIGQILDCFSQDFDTEELAPLKHTITLRTCHPFDADASDNLKQALFCFFEMLTQQVNGNIRISRKSINQSEDLWKIEDTGSWLW